MLYLIADKPRENVKLYPLDALPRLRPVEAFEQYDEPEEDVTVWQAVGLLIVTACGAATVFGVLALVLL